MSVKKPIRHNRTVIYECPWVNLYRDRVELPSGKILPDYHILDFGLPSVGVVVVNDSDEILFVHAYRYPLDSVDWEIPTGRMEPGETVEEAGARETLEESGYETFDHKLIYSFHPINGISDETFHVVTCRAGHDTGKFDLNEVAGRKWIPVKEVREMIRRGEVTDGFTLTALLLYLQLI